MGFVFGLIAMWGYSTIPNTTLGFGQTVLLMLLGYAASAWTND